MKMYRVYYAPEGSQLEFCGEHASLAKAKAMARAKPGPGARLPEQQYDTAYARMRGQKYRGMVYPPTPGKEVDEPVFWHGEFCVCEVKFEGD